MRNTANCLWLDNSNSRLVWNTHMQGLCVRLLLICRCLLSDQSTAAPWSPLLRQHDALPPLSSPTVAYRREQGSLLPSFPPLTPRSLWCYVGDAVQKLCDSGDGNRSWFQNHSIIMTGVSILWVTTKPPPLPHSSKRKIKAFGLFAYHLHTNPNWMFLDARRLGSLFITWDCNLFLLYVEFASDYYVPPLRPGNKRQMTWTVSVPPRNTNAVEGLIRSSY